MFFKKNKIEQILKLNKKKRLKEISDSLDTIVFLDYDGVINLDLNNFGDKKFDINCINNLNRFCLKYNARIVVISSWRKYSNYEKLLYNSGLDKRIIIDGKTKHMETAREDEVCDYLLEHPYIGKFIIIDDGKFNLLNKYQVQTITKYGFNDEKYDEACILIESIKENK